MKTFLFLALSLSLTACSFIGQGGSNVKTVNGMKLVPLTLENDLEVLIIQDPRFKKSSAAMAVMVGSLEDPETAQGLAHYLEHMLFLGTKEFPKPDEYGQYMQLNGGWNNAYTDDEITNYMFEVDSSAFEGALNRFSRFFVSPLFDATYLEREKNAVNSEFEKNIKSDGWRANRYTSLLANNKHPYSKFSTGSTKTLSAVTRSEVIEFYQKYYSSNNMKLVIMGTQPIEELEAWAKKYFKDIPNFKVTRPKYESFYFDKNATDRLHFVKGIKDSDELSILFNIPDPKADWASKPTTILGELVGDEGKNSLLSYLKKQGWALSLGAGDSVWRAFAINIDLTPLGRQNYEKVLASVFQYLELVKKKGYPKYIFDEAKSLRQIELDNLEPSASGDRAAFFAAQLVDHPIDSFLERTFLLSEHSPKDFGKLLSFIRPDNVHVIVYGKNEKTDKKEDIFGIEYRTAPLTISAAPENALISYPEKNKYIPTEFKLVTRAKEVGKPTKVDLKGRGWLFAQTDTELGIARGYVRLEINSDVENTPKNAVLNRLFVESKMEELREWMYPIGQAQYNFNLDSANGDQMALFILGYSQNLRAVLSDIIKDKENARQLNQLTLTEAAFNDVKNKLVREISNVDDMVASRRLQMEFSQSREDKDIRWQDMKPLVAAVTLQDVQEFGRKFFSNISLREVAYGNILESDYVDIADHLFSSLNASPMSAAQVEQKKRQFRLVPPEKNYSMLVKGENNNHAMMAIYNFGEWNIDNHAKALILDEMVSQPYFAELRTNQQLGYVANASTLRNYGYVGLMALIQSGKYPSLELFKKSDAFLKAFFKEQSETVTDEMLRPVIAATVKNLLVAPNTLYERYSLFLGHALWYDGNFSIRKDFADRVQATTAQDYKNFVKSMLVEKKPALLTYYYSGSGSKLTKKDLPGAAIEKTSDVNEWIYADPYVEKKKAP